MFPDAFDPVLFGVLTAAVEEESVAAYEAGYADGLRSAAYLLPDDVDDLGPPDSVAEAAQLPPPPAEIGTLLPPLEAFPAPGDDGDRSASSRPQ